MPRTAAERLEFVPPRDKGWLRPLALALLAHIVLIAALTWGVNWKHSDEATSFEAELWTSAARQARPEAVETPQPEPVPAPVPAPKITRPAPAVVPRPAPVPQPIKVPQAKAAALLQHDADIALAQEKERKLHKQQKEAERQKAQKLQEKQETELQAKQDKERQKKKEKDLKVRQELADAKAAAIEKAAAVADKKKQAVAAEKQHQDAVKHIIGMAETAGGANAAGTSGKSGGPSPDYAGKVRARVLPNVVFTDEITGNLMAEVEVSITPDGTIMSQRLLKSSGNKAWDDAVIKAIIRTGSLPRDTDGRSLSRMIIQFRPN